MGAQAHAQLFLGIGGVGGGIPGSDGQGLQRLAGTGFGGGSRLSDGGFEDAAMFTGECQFHVGFSFG
ncbi:MAG TPA: hypothetical protein DIT03_15350 [Candidatus Accumulibacter sp.]|nr:hypothetical protein [Accumulibacter sp.]